MEANKLEVLLDGAVGMEEANGLINEVEGLISISKDAGLKLGAKLKEMRKALKAKKRWYGVVEEIARMTGYTGRTILNWVDGNSEYEKISDSEAMAGCAGEDDSEVPAKKANKVKAFSATSEIRNLVGRLNSNHVSFVEAAEEFNGRLLAKTVSTAQAGDAEFIEKMRDVVLKMAESRGMEVEVDIRVSLSEIKEAA